MPSAASEDATSQGTIHAWAPPGATERRSSGRAARPARSRRRVDTRRLGWDGSGRSRVAADRPRNCGHVRNVGRMPREPLGRGRHGGPCHAHHPSLDGAARAHRLSRRLRRRLRLGRLVAASSARSGRRSATPRLRRRPARLRAPRRPRPPTPGPVPGITEDGVGAVGRRRQDHPHGHDRARGQGRPRRALVTARDGIRAMGGYVGASRTENDEDRPLAQITYRIPADRWEDALDLLRGLNGQTSKVVTEQTEAVEVTGQVIDLEARIRNLRASETALQKIATGATRISDVLEVEHQLTERPRPDRAAQRPAGRPPGSGRLRDADGDVQRADRRGRCRARGAGSRRSSSTKRRPAWSMSCSR